MALSEKVTEEILEIKSHLRTALKHSATNEKSYVSKCLADMLVSLESLEKAEMIMDKMERRRPGDSGLFGQFFGDFG